MNKRWPAEIAKVDCRVDVPYRIHRWQQEMGELIDRKEHNRVEMAEYMTAKKIDDEAALL